MPNDPERVAVVTGGSRGIGLAVVRKLVGDGFLVAACSRHPSPALPTGMKAMSASSSSILPTRIR
ncbi:SDR family NAD(P)-dependent oxidoreductase [Rhizobium beringeri]